MKIENAARHSRNQTVTRPDSTQRAQRFSQRPQRKIRQFPISDFQFLLSTFCFLLSFGTDPSSFNSSDDHSFAFLAGT
jgi:hypothetical protein